MTAVSGGVCRDSAIAQRYTRTRVSRLGWFCSEYGSCTICAPWWKRALRSPLLALNRVPRRLDSGFSFANITQPYARVPRTYYTALRQFCEAELRRACSQREKRLPERDTVSTTEPSAVFLTFFPLRIEMLLPKPILLMAGVISTPCNDDTEKLRKKVFSPRPSAFAAMFKDRFTCLYID